MRRTAKEKTKYTAALAVAGTIGISVLVGGSFNSDAIASFAESGPDEPGFFAALNDVPVSPADDPALPDDPTVSGDPSVGSVPAIPVPPKYIIHGGGALGPASVTNSLTALRNAVDASQHFIELDFQLSSDGVPVCIHDWNYRFLPGFTMDDFPITEAEFREQRIFGVYEPLLLPELVGVMKASPSLYIITDGKDCQETLLSSIRRIAPELVPRFIVQIYSISEYERVRRMGFENVILTLYELPNEIKTDPETILSIVDGIDLWGITFAAELADAAGYVDTLLRAGIPLYVHTVNDPDAIARYLAMGITGVYTDCIFTE